MEELAPRATIEEAAMTDQQRGTMKGLPDEVKAAVRGMWALGDYNRYTRELDIQQIGRDLVDACGIGAGQGPATSRFAPPRPAPTSSPPTSRSRTWRRVSARPTSADSSWRGSRGMPRHRRSATANSPSSPH